MTSVPVRAAELLNERAMEEAGVEPAATVHIPLTNCCGSLPWNCECPQACERCGEVGRGQGLCGHCFGGRE